MTESDKKFHTASLYDALQHGDSEHCAWLYDAIYAYFHDQVIPPVRGGGRKEAEIAELRLKVEELLDQLQAYQD